MALYNNKQDLKQADTDALLNRYEDVKAKLRDLSWEGNHGYIGQDYRQWLNTQLNALQCLHATTAELRRRGHQVY